MPHVNLPGSAPAGSAREAGGADASTGPKITIASGMTIVYGFLASIILTEYLKVASKAVYAGPAFPYLALILLASGYLFYMIFDTLVWLVHYDKNPTGNDSRPPSPRVEIVLWLLCRCVEFILLIWLYDFVNIASDVSSIKPPNDLMPQLARLCFNIGAVCLGWAAWFLIFSFTHVFREIRYLPGETTQAQRDQRAEQHQRERREDWTQLAFHVIFALAFFALGVWFGSSRRPKPHCAYALTYLVTVVNVLRVYVIQKIYYSEHFYLYRA